MTVAESIVLSLRSGGGDPASAGSIPPVDVSAHHPARLSARERFAFLDQFAVLIDSGIQIPVALQSLRAESQNERVAAVLGQLGELVVGGRPLSEAMAELPRAFPTILRQMVRAGEAAGNLPEMLRRTVEMLEAEAQSRARLRSAMIYPAVMALLTTGVVVFLLGVIVPKFQRLFQQKAAMLPAPTRWLMAIGDFTSAQGVWIVVGVAAAAIGAALFVRTPRGLAWLDHCALRTPLLGAVYRMSVLSRSIRTLGLLLQSGVPVHAALEHAGEVAGSPTYRGLWRRAQVHVQNGGTLTEAIRASDRVPPTLRQVVAAGEATASLDAALLKTAAQYARDLERRIRDLLTMVEPTMVVVMGSVVGFIALSIMLPIFRMSRV